MAAAIFPAERSLEDRRWSRGRDDCSMSSLKPEPNSDKRPPFPADIRRTVLIEAGHRCAIPTCRELTVEVHHIVPWAKCRKHEYKNLIALRPNRHARADRGEIDRSSLRLYKLNLRFAH